VIILAKITGILIISLASLVAIFCILLKIKVRPDLSNKRNLKVKFLIAVSIMMAFFTGFFTSCKPSEKPVTNQNVTVPQPLCYTAMPAVTPVIDDSNDLQPLCYKSIPIFTPTVTCINTPQPLCYKPMPAVTPTAVQNSTSQPLCYAPLPPVTPTVVQEDGPQVLCYEVMPAVTPTEEKESTSEQSFNNRGELRKKKLALLKEISEKNIIAEEIILTVQEIISKT